MQKIIFAAGCFWGIQHYFDQVPGVLKTTVGYTGGTTPDPTYELVCSTNTGHAEAVEIEFDEEIVSLDTLIKHFFKIHDPTLYNKQGQDVGSQYRSAIFFYNDDQHITAERIKLEIQSRYKNDIVTQFAPVGAFHNAQEYRPEFSERSGHKFCHTNYLNP